ncbi:MAG: ABC-2 transporter permease [Clostridia bacterium]|jgi:ABC-2 type transport system permease protein
MYHLILKDLLLQKKTVAISLVYIIFFIFALQQVGPVAYVTAIMGFSYMLVVTACAHEDKSNGDTLMNSLPIRRSQVVLAKYLSVYIYMALGTIAYVLFIALIRNTGIAVTTHPITLENFITALITVTLMMGIYFPIFFKLGYIKSRFLPFILFSALYTGMSALGQLMEKNRHKPWAEGIYRFLTSQSDTTAPLMLLAGVLILALISYGLSLHFYRNREF